MCECVSVCAFCARAHTSVRVCKLVIYLKHVKIFLSSMVVNTRTLDGKCPVDSKLMGEYIMGK